MTACVVLLGRPGAGKGTQAPLLAEHLGVPILASGDLLRAAVAAGTPLGLEADRYMSAASSSRTTRSSGSSSTGSRQPDAANGAILDGFPRTRARPRPSTVPWPSEGQRVDRALHRRAARRPRRADGEPADLPGERARLQHRDQPARARAGATSTARRSSSARTTRRRPSAPAWRSRCRRSRRSPTTTAPPASSARSTAASRSTPSAGTSTAALGDGGQA